MTNDENLQMQIYGKREYHIGLSVRTTGTGPRLLLIHGGSGSRTHWCKNVETLAHRFSVSTIDLPGFGESAQPPADLSIPDYVEWVAHAIRLITAAEPYHLIGFSFGGALSAAVAATLATQRLKPSRITLVSPAGFGKPTDRTIKLEKIRKSEHDTIEDIKAATARNLGRWMLATMPDVDDPAIDIHLQNVSLSRFDSRVISLRESLIKDLQKLDVPLQILLGEQDPLIFPSLASRQKALSLALPHATIETIPSAGHWLQYEASDVVNTRIQKFHT